MNVAHLLSERAASCGDRPAIIEGPADAPRTLTFAALELAAGQVAARLREAGLRLGDPVLVLVPMSAELYIVLSAIFRSGLVAMFLDPSAGREHIESCCALQPPRAFIGSSKAHRLRFISPALRRIPIKFSTGKSILRAQPLLNGEHAVRHAAAKVAQSCTLPYRGVALRTDRQAPTPPLISSAAECNSAIRQNTILRYIETCEADTPALIRFTSGSTGQPKGAVRTHGFLREQQRVIEKSLRLTAGEVDLATLPIFVLANLASGVTSIIPHANLRAPGAIQPLPVVRQILELRPQRVSASPAFLERLADHCSQTNQQLESFRSIFTGGAPVFPHLLDKFQAMSPEADIVAVYGSTEAEPIAQISRSEITVADREAMGGGQGLLAGRPDPAIHVRILREGSCEETGGLTAAEFEAACQRSGEPGQIVVSGPHVQPGYLHGIGDAETKFQINGTTWHQTGDAGCLDALGRLWLLGRSGARIQDEYGTLYPFQVECAASRDPQVRRAALVAHRGDRVLVVEPRNGVEPTGLKASLAWAGIERVKFVRRIPLDKRHNAKIDYAALKKIL